MLSSHRAAQGRLCHISPSKPGMSGVGRATRGCCWGCLDAKLGFVTITESSQGRRCWLWGRSRGISSCHFPEHLSWAIPAEDSATLSPFLGTVWTCAASQEVKGRGPAAVAAGESSSPRNAAPGTCVCPQLCVTWHRSWLELGSAVLLARSQGGAVILPRAGAALARRTFL